MKRFWLSIMAALLVTAIAVPAFAWEFSMTGEYEYRMQYYSRMGEKDIFGDAGLQNVPNAIQSGSGAATNPYLVANPNAAWIGLAGPNYYMNGWAAANEPAMQDNATAAGVRITRGGFARWNNDAFFTDQRLTFNPAIRVNNAIRVFGVYTVGGLRQKYSQRRLDGANEFSPGAPPFERYYMLHSSDAAYNTGAIGSWEQVRATIQLPIALFSIGMKDFPFGVGSVYANNLRTDSFLAVVPYGPMRLLFGFWPGQGAIAGATSFDTRPDTGTKNNWRMGVGATYDNGPLSVGVLPIYGAGHFDRAYNADGFNQDVNAFSWLAFVKYTNGRFFLNADYFVANTDTYRVKATAALANPATAIPTYREGYTFFAEAGVLAGPTKLSLMYASVSGPVWNNFGAAANGNFRQSKAYGGTSCNYQVLQPYSYLMFPVYGGGNNTFNVDGTGQMSDAFAFAGRLDYATAANLNFFGSFMWAHRLENAGTYAGQYFASSGALAAVPSAAPTAATSNAWIAYSQAFKGGAAATNPYVDDGFIGWEAQAGVSWKLLEGLTMDVAYSYWRLGEWFDQAYQAFTLVGANGGGLAGNTGQGIQLGRDPIQSLRGSFTINF